MVELFEQNIRTNERQSSKGNQLKWLNDNIWYKADYTGYEGMVEYVISKLLQYSDLKGEEYVMYDTEEIHYGHRTYRGCWSKNFLPEGWQLITLERLFQNFYGKGLNHSLYTIENHENRIRFLVEQTERITGLKEFGIYISKLLTLDTLFLNEDRHTHNIAVLLDEEKQYHYCPIFDNGAALLSDTTMDYPMDMEVLELIRDVEPKTFCQDFDEQLELVEKLYGQHIEFNFKRETVIELLENEKYYPKDVKGRVADILLEQKRKYSYLFR